MIPKSVVAVALQPADEVGRRVALGRFGGADTRYAQQSCPPVDGHSIAHAAGVRAHAQSPCPNWSG